MPEACKDPVLRRLPENFPALMWHGDHIELPKGGIHLLGTAKCACAGFRVGKKAYGLVPHLEMTAAMIDDPDGVARRADLVGNRARPLHGLMLQDQKLGHQKTIRKAGKFRNLLVKTSSPPDSGLGFGGVLQKPGVGGGDAVVDGNARLPTQLPDPGDVQKLSGGAVRLGSIPPDIPGKTDDLPHLLGQFLDRQILPHPDIHDLPAVVFLQ